MHVLRVNFPPGYRDVYTYSDRQRAMDVASNFIKQFPLCRIVLSTDGKEDEILNEGGIGAVGLHADGLRVEWKFCEVDDKPTLSVHVSDIHSKFACSTSTVILNPATPDDIESEARRLLLSMQLRGPHVLQADSLILELFPRARR